METTQYQGKSTPFDNTREALAYIGAAYGAQMLLSEQVETLLIEVAPHVPPLGRNVVHTVICAGALDILKEALNASEEAQENAYDRAAKCVVDNFGIIRNLAEDKLTEFIDALGWEISAATPVTEVERLPRKSERKAHSVYVDIKAGQRNLSFGKYMWRVLDVKEGKALLLSEDILEDQIYHHESVPVTWEQCDLRGYLNGEFLRSFEDEEQRKIEIVTNINENNQWYRTSGGKETKDRIFLLSVSEVVRYFGDSGQLKKRTPNGSYKIIDQYNIARRAKYEKNEYWWWLRSPGEFATKTTCVAADGFLIMYGATIGDGNTKGVRPALWLNLK
jgi:hypothetical protein